MNIYSRHINVVIRFRFFVIGLCLVITLLCGYLVSQSVIATSLTKLFFGDNPAFQTYQQLSREFSSDIIVIIGFHEPAMFDESKRNALRAAAEEISQLPDVRHVDGIHSAERIRGTFNALEIEKYFILLDDEALSVEQVKHELRQDKIYSGSLLSADGLNGALIVEWTLDESRTAERIPSIVDGIVAVMVKHGFARSSFHLAGLQSQIAEVVNQSYTSITVILPITIIVLFIVVFFLYRQLTPVFITIGVAGMAVLWTMAFGVFLDREINILMAMVPAIILIVSFSDIIHLSSAYILELGNGLSQHDALVKSGAEVGRACLFTSLTTFFGFASMSFVPTPIFRHIGIVLGTGVGIALLLAMTLVPVIYSLLPVPTKRFGPSQHFGDDFIARIIIVCHRGTARHPWPIILCFIVLIGVSMWGIGSLEIETDFSQRLSESNHIRQGEKFFKDHFSGATFLDLYVSVDEDGGILDPQLLASVNEVSREIEEWPEVDRIFSFLDLIHIIHREMNGPQTGQLNNEGKTVILDDSRLPATRELYAQYLLLFEMSSDQELERLLNFDRDKMKISIRLKTNGFREAADIGDKIRNSFKEHMGTAVTLEVSGLYFLFGNWLDNIISGQEKGLFFAIISIALMMMIAFRSVKIGFTSMIPNLIPLFTLGGYVGLAWDKVDSDTMLIAMIAIGLGVDDTIHFLNRIRLESWEGRTSGEQLYNAFQFSGRAIIQTTIILTCGFLPFILSDYFTTRIMGTLLPMTLLSALAADLLLVPALIEVGIMKFRDTTKSRQKSKFTTSLDKVAG